MARIKKGPTAENIRREHSGFSFSAANGRYAMRVAPSFSRNRNVNQQNRQNPNQHAIRYWRSLSAAEKNNWNIQASLFPQYARYLSSRQLSGYHLFLRYHSFFFLAAGCGVPFLRSPAIASKSYNSVSLSFFRMDEKLLFVPDFVDSSNNFLYLLYLTSLRYPSRITQHSDDRYMLSFSKEAAVRILYGSLYNRYAAIHPLFCSSDIWRVPNVLDYSDITSACSGVTSGIEMKEVGLEYWVQTQPEVTNSSSFSARGSGARYGEAGAEFYAFRMFAPFWLTNDSDFSTPEGQGFSLGGYSIYISHETYVPATEGRAIRLCRNATSADVGECQPYIGNNGVSYRTYRIGNLVWTIENSIETKLRDGTLIANIPAPGNWFASVLPAYCYFNSEQKNAFVTIEPTFEISEQYIFAHGLLINVGEYMLARIVAISKTNGQMFEFQNIGCIVE